MLNFLTTIYHSGVGYSAVSTAKSAVSTLVVLPNGLPLGKHPTVIRYMKGIFEARPSLPRYCGTWGVSKVVNQLQLLDLDTISLIVLTLKVTVLLALLTAQRRRTLWAIELDHMELCQASCTIHIRKVLEITKPGQHIKPIVFHSYPNRNTCIVQHLLRYCALTAPLRPQSDRGQLLVSYRRPHAPVVEDTISRWIKASLESAGINTAVFAAHSTRSAGTSAAAHHEAPLDLIMQAANWQHARTFAKFYHRDVPVSAQDTTFMDAVLKSA